MSDEKEQNIRAAKARCYQNTPLFLQIIRLPAAASIVVINTCKGGTPVRKWTNIQSESKFSPACKICSKSKLKIVTFLAQMSLQLGQSRDSLNHQEQMERKKDHKQKLQMRRPAKTKQSSKPESSNIWITQQSPRCGRTSGKPEWGPTEAPHWLTRSN